MNILIEPERIILSEQNRWRAEIFPFGALLNQFCIHDGAWRNVVAAYEGPHDAKARITHGHRSAKLSPFAGRLSQGRFVWNDTSHDVRKFMLNGDTLHGLLFDAPFVLTDSGTTRERAWATLEYAYRREAAGFDFDYDCKVTYTLHAGGSLDVRTVLYNAGHTRLPISDGWHPYFQLEGALEDWRLQIDSRAQAELSAALVPTGNLCPDAQFATPQRLGGLALDNCFVLNLPGGCRLQSDGLSLSIHTADYPYLQVYVPPQRDSIALENLSGAPNALNNGMGLVLLEPGQSRAFATRYTLAARQAFQAA